MFGRSLVSALAGLSLLLSLAVAGCSPRYVRVKPRPATVELQAISAQDQTRLDKHCPFGAPKLRPDWGFGRVRTVYRDGYVLEHSSTDKIPLWVCEAVTLAQLVDADEDGIPRVDNFRADDKLPKGERSELSDYKGSGYDRGHMAPAGNQEVDERLKDETFFLSNMSPQVGAHNQQVWRHLEDFTREWARNQDAREIRIITGGFFHSEDEDSDVIEYRVIGKGKVAVPTHFYKIVVGKDKAGEWQAVAFVMENRRYKKPWRFGSYIKPVSWIEEHTGIDFMPLLDISERARVEGKPGTCFKISDCQ